MNKNEYIVAKVEKKIMLLRVDNVTEKEIQCTIESTRHKDSERVSIKSKEILANLGKDPSFGKVHGVNIETWKKDVEHDDAGIINFFHLLPEAQEGRLLRAFDKSCAALKKHGLTHFLPTNIEVRHPAGKWAGKYKYTGKDSEEHPDTIILYPKDDHDFMYVLFHEFGHGVWFRLFKSPKGRAAWVRAYHSYITVTQLSDDDIGDIVKNHLSSRPSDAKGQMSEDETEVFESMLEYVKRVHSLTIEDLDTLHDSGDDLSDYWPDNAETTKKTYEISEYAMKNVKEMFAESFAFYMAGKKLPSKIEKLMEKSIAAASNTRSI